ncbi:hypothetical protein ACFSQZ_00510 [Rubritalea spongiae]|uniref:Uncharacterized protein n=1 Tax=Rubritalea spongiae TaxID=430797 RepID=A0ABW5DX78_9BACT
MAQPYDQSLHPVVKLLAYSMPMASRQQNYTGQNTKMALWVLYDFRGNT